MIDCVLCVEKKTEIKVMNYELFSFTLFEDLE